MYCELLPVQVDRLKRFLDVLREICDAGMSAEEEDRGVGRPSENIRITAVEVL